MRGKVMLHSGVGMDGFDLEHKGTFPFSAK